MTFRHLGQRGEYLARVFLEKKGMDFVRANFSRRGGELDLIMLDGDDVVFVEVKTRRYSTAARFGRGAERIDERKRHNILRTSSRFLWEERELCEGKTPRYDAVEIYLEDLESRRVHILHTPCAFGL